jgi:hypothetical protein
MNIDFVLSVENKNCLSWGIFLLIVATLIRMDGFNEVSRKYEGEVMKDIKFSLWFKHEDYLDLDRNMDMFHKGDIMNDNNTDITLSELKEKKKELEANILSLLKDFQNETGICIDKIGIDTITYTHMSNEKEQLLNGVDVDFTFTSFP